VFDGVAYGGSIPAGTQALFGSPFIAVFGGYYAYDVTCVEGTASAADSVRASNTDTSTFGLHDLTTDTDVLSVGSDLVSYIPQIGALIAGPGLNTFHWKGLVLLQAGDFIQFFGAGTSGDYTGASATYDFRALIWHLGASG